MKGVEGLPRLIQTDGTGLARSIDPIQTKKHNHNKPNRPSRTNQPTQKTTNERTNPNAKTVYAVSVDGTKSRCGSYKRRENRCLLRRVLAR